ncbi:hypothetical protein CR203_18595 [Salipaludibacillus neizhouensis]|uniref:Uncharacterized protein n=1 Tax=Salipaludibacillus neizhouensis TaxID=885475 RepID=A0A3A9K6C5_9BACI|nr:TnsD family Tn7-like transposition protein [Salipaludibacillus neizhouensis]RKL65861.1 hypothetical protein CR203_18595 [Salipaludibacillus neizhouensis]
MLSFFPIIYKDELLYSVFARYHIKSGNTYPSQTSMDLFDEEYMRSYAHLPRKIETTYNKIQYNQMSLIDWIFNHTLYFYMFNFSTEKTRGNLSPFIETGKGANSFGNVIIKTNEFFKYCPKCFKEDSMKFGESFWRKDHQLFGVKICLKHHVWLLDSKINWQPRYKVKHFSQFEVPNEENCPELHAKEDLINIELKDKLIKIANECTKVGSKNLHINFENVPLMYRHLLYREGYIKGQATNNQKLYKDFRKYYGNELITLLEADFDESKRSNWLATIIKKHKQVFHPLKHVLLSIFLNESVDELYKYSNKFNPFGEGPYICLNPYANHYKRKVIRNVELALCLSEKEQIGIFECSCGFTFSRLSKEPRGTLVKEIIHVNKTHSHKFEGLLISNDTLKNEEIKRLKTKYKHYKNRLARKNKYISDEVIEYYRSKWINLINEYKNRDPNISLGKLKKQDPITYKFLYINDKEWLNKITPKSNKSGAKIVDWKARDQELLTCVKDGYNSLINKETPTRITYYSIGREINHLNLITLKALKKLPKTKAYFETVVESTEQFQVRRINYVINHSFHENEEITVNKVRLRARIAKGKSDYIEQYIEEKVRSILV